MQLSEEQVKDLLEKIKDSIRKGKYQFAIREENEELTQEFIIDEVKKLETILSLQVSDFCGLKSNRNEHYKEKWVYIFTKKIRLLERYGPQERDVNLYIKFNQMNCGYCIVISFHEMKYSMSHYFEMD